LGETYLLLLGEPSFKNTSAGDRKKLWGISKSALYRQLNELEKIGLYFKKNAETPKEINFYISTLKTMRKRRVSGTPNPAGFLSILYDSFTIFPQKTEKALALHYILSAGLMQAAGVVLHNKAPSEIIKIADNFFGNHSLRNVCVVLLLLAQANPYTDKPPIPKGKPINFERQIKRKGLYLGEAPTQEIYERSFV